MRRMRKTVARLVGGTQCVLGAVAAVSAYLMYASQTFREALGVDADEIFLVMFLLLVSATFMVLSGLVLTSEQQ